MLEGAKIPAAAGNESGTAGLQASGDAFGGLDGGLEPGDMLSTLAERFFSSAAPPLPLSSPSSASAPSGTMPALSGSFNQTAAVVLAPTAAIAATQNVTAPPVTELRSTQASIGANPQDIKDQALSVSATVAQARRDAQSPSAAAPQGAAAPGGLRSAFGNAVGSLTGGAAVGLAADMVMPGAGAVMGVMATAFQAASQSLSAHGGGTDATFMRPAGETSFTSRRATRGAGGSGYSRHAPAPSSPAAPTPESQAVLTRLSNGPGFGARPDNAAVSLTGASLQDMKIGNMSMDRYMRSLDRLDEQCQGALDAIHVRTTRGLTLDRSTVEQMLNHDVGLNQGNPRFVSGATL